MTDGDLIELIQQAIWVTLLASGPLVLTAMIIGTVIAFLQALTQIQEMTLTFLPKMLAAFLILSVSGPYVGNVLKGFAYETYDRIAAPPRQ